MNSGSERVKKILNSLGVLNSANIKEIPESTRTSAEAARAIGCSVSDIAKSILFRSRSGNPVMVIAPGSNRIDEKKIESLTGEKIEKAGADFVKEKTGFAIGGVPPVLEKEYERNILKFIDKGLMNHKAVWAAAGTPNSVFSISPELLAKVAGGKIADVSQMN